MADFRGEELGGRGLRNEDGGVRGEEDWGMRMEELGVRIRVFPLFLRPFT